MPTSIAKGVFDILPHDPDPTGKWRESHLWHYLETIARECATTFGYQEIRTPLFESTELFQRAAGDTSDLVVKKEMYTFADRAGRSLTLRPEGTAPVLRAYIEKRLHEHPLQKFFYLAPMFRYERQQSGRYRQHHQFGVEAIGSASPYRDAEVIHLLFTFLEKVGIKSATLQINSLGTVETRADYGKALQQFLQTNYDRLSTDSKERFYRNPLRILDSKDPTDQEIVEGAPPLADFLTPASKEYFVTICSLLRELDIPFRIDPSLVRGLDYYSHTVFEVSSSSLGAQNSLGGGGRYDGLLEQLGGPNLPSIGFGIGVERVLLALLAEGAPVPPSPTPFVWIIPMGAAACKKGFSFLSSLRKKQIPADMDLSERKIKPAMRVADQMGARYVFVLGEEELQAGHGKLKEMQTGEEIPFSFEGFIPAVDALLKKKK